MKKEHSNTEIPIQLERVPINNGIKMDNKSFNESTMAISKLQRS